jgi:hypothetical protein
MGDEADDDGEETQIHTTETMIGGNPREAPDSRGG